MNADEILQSYSGYGIWYADELLLPPPKALELVDAIHAAGISIVGVDTWSKVGGSIVEIHNGFSFDTELRSTNPVDATYASALDCIHHDLPTDANFVSLLLRE